MAMFSRFLITTGMAGLAAAGAHAATTVYDFDDLALATHQNSFSEGGWTFDTETSGSGPVNLAVESGVGRLSSGPSDKMVTFGFPAEAGSPITMVLIRPTNDEPFKLESLWVGDGFGNANLRFEAYLNGSAVGVAAVDVNIFNTSTQVTFTGWDQLDEIRVSNSSGSPDLNFEIDDLAVAPVPEPGLPLLVAAGALQVFRRRR